MSVVQRSQVEEEKLKIAEEDFISSLSAKKDRDVSVPLDCGEQFELRNHAEPSYGFITVIKDFFEVLQNIDMPEGNLAVFYAALCDLVDKLMLVASTILRYDGIG